LKLIFGMLDLTSRASKM